MFGWFKKFNRLLPDDVQKGFMTSNFCVVKLGETIEIPENVVCFVTYKDKKYLELQTGKHELSRELLLDLFTKQVKKDEKIKKIKADFYFINKTPLNLDRSFVNRLYYKTCSSKSFIDFKITANIDNVKNFYNFIRTDYAFVSGKQSVSQLLDYIEEFLRKYFLRKTLETSNLTEAIILDLNNKLQNLLKSIGISLTNFEIKISTKEFVNEKNENSEFNFFETDKMNLDKPLETNQVVEITNENQTQTNAQEEKINDDICPQCKAKKIKNSVFCTKCGFKF